MPTDIGDLIGEFSTFLTTNTIVLLVFAAGAVLSLVVYGVKKIAKGGR